MVVNLSCPVPLEDYLVESRRNLIAVPKLPRPTEHSNFSRRNFYGGVDLEIRRIDLVRRRFSGSVANYPSCNVSYRAQRGDVLKGIVTLRNMLIRPNFRRGRVKA
jgi:hypothetical protein